MSCVCSALPQTGVGGGTEGFFALMGDANVRCYRVWTFEEEEALRKGVQKHGIGAWEIIRQDALFKGLLA